MFFDRFHDWSMRGALILPVIKMAGSLNDVILGDNTDAQ